MSINPALKEKAVQLRLEGRSYGEIQKQLDLKSKGTLSAWFRNVELSPAAKQALRANIERASHRGFFEFNKKRSEQIKQENAAAYAGGLKKIGSITRRELLLIGAALYWGEGTKYERENGNLALVFTNADPFMVRVFMRFVREILQIEEDRIRAGIHMYDSSKISASRMYWSKVTNLPSDRFYISQQRSRASKGRRDVSRLPHGTVCIRINNRVVFHQVRGMIAGLAHA